ncbi:MAG TPA: metallophosphoesterase, partial [Candidatus Ozemobacteraceae bacterium]|nr:metallophosphoesterase [Candidatus Ozemobacteraceae bacterium]
MLHRVMNRLIIVLLLSSWALVPVWSEQFPLRILHTNDWHGTFQPLPSVWRDASAPRPIGGAAILGTVLSQRKADILRRGGRYLLVDAGDLFQGSMEVNLTKGMAMIDLYNHLGYAVTALGNHDFDYGPQALRAAYARARFPVVCANLEGRDRFWRNSLRTSIGPVKVGVIGVITPELPAVSVKKHLSGVRLRNIASTASAEAAALRRQGCDLVIL